MHTVKATLMSSDCLPNSAKVPMQTLNSLTVNALRKSVQISCSDGKLVRTRTGDLAVFSVKYEAVDSRRDCRLLPNSSPIVSREESPENRAEEENGGGDAKARGDGHAVRSTSKICSHPARNECPLVSRMLKSVSRAILRISISVDVCARAEGSACDPSADRI